MSRSVPRTVIALVVLAGCSQAGTHAQSTTSPTRTSLATVTVTSTLDGLSTLPQRVHWRATPSDLAQVSQVDFLIDGQLAWTEKKTPYDYGDDGNWLVTSFLSPGRHVFQNRVVTTGGKSLTDTVTATVSTPVQLLPS